VKGITLSKNLTTNEHKIKSVEARSLRPVIPVKEAPYVLPITTCSKTDKHMGLSSDANKGLILPFFSPKFPS